MILPIGTILYRGAPTVEESITPRFCKDTHKIGSYLSPGMYLPLMMMKENNFEKHYISKYITTCSMRLEQGKGKSNGSHFDKDISPIKGLILMKDLPHNSMEFEVFLNEVDLKNLKFITSYLITDDIYNIYFQISLTPIQLSCVNEFDGAVYTNGDVELPSSISFENVCLQMMNN